VVLGLPFVHIPTCFAEDRRRGHDIDAINLSQVRTGDVKQLGTKVELRRIPFLLSRSFRFSSGRLAPWRRSSLCRRYCSSCRSYSVMCLNVALAFTLAPRRTKLVILSASDEDARRISPSFNSPHFGSCFRSAHPTLFPFSSHFV